MVAMLCTSMAGLVDAYYALSSATVPPSNRPSPAPLPPVPERRKLTAMTVPPTARPTRGCANGYYSGGSIDSSDSSSSDGAEFCPETYTLFNGGCYKYVQQWASFPSAMQACRNSENGWLATLNTQAKLGVVSALGISQSAWFGLYKTSSCTGSYCTGKLRWDTCNGCTASTDNYLLNMKRYVNELINGKRNCSHILCPRFVQW